MGHDGIAILLRNKIILQLSQDVSKWKWDKWKWNAYLEVPHETAAGRGGHGDQRERWRTEEKWDPK
jgi:hypothetical protein